MFRVPSDDAAIEAVKRDRVLIGQLREQIRATFKNYLTTAGYVEHAPGTIIPEHDNTVLFTGSTLSTFKPTLIDGSIPEVGWFMCQSCLRTQNAKKIAEGCYLRWCSYFSGLGILAPHDKLGDICRDVWAFLEECVESAQSRLRVRVSRRDLDLCDAWRRIGLEDLLEIDSKDAAYYRHKFGMPGVGGRNCNIVAVDNRSGAVDDLGNIIMIENDVQAIGVEAAFGVETIVSRTIGMQSSIEAALITDIVPAGNLASLSVADALSACMVILHAGVRPIATNRGRVLRAYLQGVSKARRLAGISVSDIARFAREFEVREFYGSTQLPDRVAEYIETYENLTARGLSSDAVNGRTGRVFSASG